MTGPETRSNEEPNEAREWEESSANWQELYQIECAARAALLERTEAAEAALARVLAELRARLPGVQLG